MKTQTISVLRLCRQNMKPIAVAVAMTIISVSALSVKSNAEPSAATSCPPLGVSNINLAKNPSFETIGPNGSPTSWPPGTISGPVPSAAKDWFMHSSNNGDKVTSRLVPTTVPGPGGTKMLHFIAGGNEGGPYQSVDLEPKRMMFSAWVYVKRGMVVLQPHGSNVGPNSWSQKHNQWEQLRACTDGTVPNNFLIIWQQDPNGGEFFIDRVEFKEMAPP